MIKELTDQQKLAIAYTRDMVITACPGSGKTTVIEEKVRSILPSVERYQGVIAITFTSKASQELKNRCKHNGYDTKQSFFGTIDKFCLDELIKPFLSHLWCKSEREYEIVESLDDKLVGFFLNKKVPEVFDIALDNGFKKLYENGYMWMSSFAGLANFILDNSKSAVQYLKAKYTHIFIDEYQDSSKEQHELFLRLVDLGLIGTAVGDVDQSIYAFRGSSIQYLQDLIENQKKFREFCIDLNHRCHVSISNYASRVKNPLFPLNCNKNGEIRVHRFIVEGDHQKSAIKISKLINIIVNKKEYLHYSDIAILAKSNKILKEISEGLTVDYRLYIDVAIEKINTPVAHFLNDLLAFYFGRIETIQEIIDKHSIKKILNDNKKLQAFKVTIKNIKLNYESEIIAVFTEIVLELGFNNCEQEISAIGEIIGNENLKKLFRPIEYSEVQLMTLHKSKGLEFHTVIHVGLEEWVFPYREYNQDFNSPSYPDLEQETNLHYVGITRAKELCILIQTTKRRNFNNEEKNSSPSYFLNLPQLQGLYEQH